MEPTIIYLRTSTLEQTPQLQLNDCMNIISKLNITKYDKLEEQRSAYKDDDKREIFNNIISEIKKSNIRILIVWDLDRLYRNRKKLISFFQLCKIYKCKIYSFRQQWLESLNQIPEPFNDIMFNLMLEIMGWLAEDESKKKSERIKNAVRKKEGKHTLSFKGNKWGRKKINNKKMIEDILELNKQKLSMKKIASKVIYYDKSNNKKHPAPSFVWKIIQDNTSK